MSWNCPETSGAAPEGLCSSPDAGQAEPAAVAAGEDSSGLVVQAASSRPPWVLSASNL